MPQHKHVRETIEIMQGPIAVKASAVGDPC
jgi:hypothetical protein